jgi:hypothetical protein
MNHRHKVPLLAKEDTSRVAYLHMAGLDVYEMSEIDN